MIHSNYFHAYKLNNIWWFPIYHVLIVKKHLLGLDIKNSYIYSKAGLYINTDFFLVLFILNGIYSNYKKRSHP